MVGQRLTLDEQLEACAGLVGQGSAHAISGLSQMVGQEITVTSFRVTRIPVGRAPDLVGGYESISVGIYLAVSGCASGHMFMVFQPKIAMALVDLLMGEPLGTTQDLDEMEESALGEMGNIMGSFFLNALANATGLLFLPSPPAVMMDMTGAILDVALADILMVSDEALVVETEFGTEDRQISGTFLVMPSPDLMGVLLQHLPAP